MTGDQKPAAEQKPASPATGQYVKTPSGLSYLDIRPGTGPAPTAVFSAVGAAVFVDVNCAFCLFDNFDGLRNFVEGRHFE